MNTRRAAAPGGLSTSDIDAIRASLDTGRKPKVMFTESAGQIAGEVGQVVRLTDPAESEEWLVVRFGRDELPFAPADLTLPPRGRATRKANGSAAPASAPPAAGPAVGASAPTAAPSTSPTAGAAATREPAAGKPATGDPGAATTTGSAEPSPRPAKRAGRKARAGKPKPPPALTVTLAYEDGEWTVAAHQGSKTLAKPYVIRPADALKMVGMLDVPGVQEAVEAIVAAELAEAAEQAERLRNELAEVEARLRSEARR